jgi:hypothetical protein
MPIRFEINRLHRCVSAIADGWVKSDEVQAFLGDVIAAEAMPFCKLFDISNARLEDPAKIVEVAATVRLYEKMIGKSGPMAIVMRKGMSVTNTEAFVSAAAAVHRVRFFTDPHSARDWLSAQGFDVPAFRQHC